MNDLPADASALAPQPQSEGWPPAPKPPGEGWTRNKFIFLIALALVVHVALIFIFAAKKPIVPRAVANVPHLQLAANASELIALGDPTLFARPNAHDFVTAFGQRTPFVAQPSFNWTESPHYLLPAPEKFGAAFRKFMQTNRPPEMPLNFKPEPKLIEPVVVHDDTMPQATTMQICGGLARRRLLGQIEFTTNNGAISITRYNPAEKSAIGPAATNGLPAMPVNDVIAPSVVQVLVDTAGNVASAVLLPDNSIEAAAHYNPADQLALQLARVLRFAPAPRLMFGEIIFNWHTVLTNAP